MPSELRLFRSLWGVATHGPSAVRAGGANANATVLSVSEPQHGATGGVCLPGCTAHHWVVCSLHLSAMTLPTTALRICCDCETAVVVARGRELWGWGVQLV